MTREEYAQLNVGDRVHFDVGRRKTRACGVVVAKRYNYIIHCRQLGHDADGRPLPISRREYQNVSLAPKLDIVTANVFADWLDENGEPRAAEKLRKAFPISDGRPLEAK